MKTKKGYYLKEICGENVIIADDAENTDFSKIISMNESVAFLWNNIQNIEFNAETLSLLLQKEYEVDCPTSHNDAETIMDEWLKAGIIEQ